MGSRGEFACVEGPATSSASVGLSALAVVSGTVQ